METHRLVKINSLTQHFTIIHRELLITLLAHNNNDYLLTIEYFSFLIRRFVFKLRENVIARGMELRAHLLNDAREKLNGNIKYRVKYAHVIID